MSPELLERAYIIFALSGFTVIPDPMEILAMPLNYLDELLAFAQGVRWVRDVKKFEAHVRRGKDISG